jgi:hypothetical protein
MIRSLIGELLIHRAEVAARLLPEFGHIGLKRIQTATMVTHGGC